MRDYNPIEQTELNQKKIDMNTLITVARDTSEQVKKEEDDFIIQMNKSIGEEK